MFNSNCLNALPVNWSVVPVQGKRPLLGKGWNHSSICPQELQNAIQRRKFPHCTGVGLLLGMNQDSAFIAVDVDSHEGSLKLQELASNSPLPQTITWTSGRPERYCCLFQVDKETALNLKSCRSPGLEFRFNGMMVVLPPSQHPLTQKPYCWIHSPQAVEMAIAPSWLISAMTRKIKVKKTPRSVSPRSIRQLTKSKSHIKASLPIPRKEYQRISVALSQLHSWRSDDYAEWIRIGMALYAHSPSLLSLWDAWSQQSPKYQEEECARKWSIFHPHSITIATLFYLAKLDSEQSVAA